MKSTALITLLGLGTLLAAGQSGEMKGKDSSAETYEHLATAIIALRQTEDGLVKGILMHHHGAAAQALHKAEKASGGDKTAAVETAAQEIANIASEGDKSIQAIKQRLLQAGHTHHTDAETKEDYIWIDSKEKKQFLDLAQRAAKLGDASAGDISKLREELSAAFRKAIAPE
jgi:hypothetical protein